MAIEEQSISTDSQLMGKVSFRKAFPISAAFIIIWIIISTAGFIFLWVAQDLETSRRCVEAQPISIAATSNTIKMPEPVVSTWQEPYGIVSTLIPLIDILIILYLTVLRRLSGKQKVKFSLYFTLTTVHMILLPLWVFSTMFTVCV